MFLYLVPLSEWRNKMLYIGQALDTGPLVLCPGLFIAAKLRLNGAILFGASLHSARLTEADLIGANLTSSLSDLTKNGPETEITMRFLSYS
jgi:uncharacterized protein YjbI with pentapeptide repeats